MSKKGAYIGGHTILKIGKSKPKGKAKNWPYKTIKPDPYNISLNKTEKRLLERRKKQGKIT